MVFGGDEPELLTLLSLIFRNETVEIGVWGIMGYIMLWGKPSRYQWSRQAERQNS